jgi:hypothetical protein
VHGYHPYAEDAEIYLPGVEKILNPNLFPVGREFFTSHASLTLFPNLLALSIRVTHLPFETGLFLWHVASIFLLLLACWEMSGVCFATARARWGSVCLVAALLTTPVAGTALYIMDQYLNPRNLAAFAAIFAVTRTLENKYIRALLWLVFAACMHPLMAAFAFSFCALLVVMKHGMKHGTKHAGSRNAGADGGVKIAAGAASALGCLLLPFGISLDPQGSQAYHQAALRHGFHYIQRWEWYEQLGILAPVVLFWWFGRIARARQCRRLELLCRSFIIYDLIYFAMALAFDLPARFESLARLQPLRSLHLLYMAMFVVMGGFVGEYVLQNRVWRWLALFVPLSAGMLMAQLALFPASAHVEWPGRAPRNQWAQAFDWIRQNTPVDAVFALDPEYMQIPAEDEIGFRCRAQRSRLADANKDNGVVSMFPPLAETWWEQVKAQTPWKKFGSEDLARLKQKYGVSWVVVQQPGIAGLDCVYQNSAVQVCRLP